MIEIHEYFLAEKNESLAFIIIGTAAIISSFYFWLAINQRFFNGLGWPLVAMAIIQLGIGSYLYYNTPKLESRVMYYMTKTPEKLKKVELPRIQKVLNKYTLFNYFEIGLVIAGIIIFVISKSGQFWKGFGLALIIQSSVMLIADYIAQNRGQIYFEHLKTLIS